MFSCPSTDINGHVLITSPYSTPYDGPYSIFDCIYAIPGAPIPSVICRYYKVDGVYALGPSKPSDCQTRAVPCLEDQIPRFSTPDKVEIPPWIASGNDLLWYREHHQP
ncbi:hypothetical protein E4T56_gene11619 [Termitomyces sp. T112]|nr:hypothetical protein E4T56_gene11619 [Termitomyces sp. T112]